MRLALALGLVAAAACTTGCLEPRVTRVVDGRPMEGRYISAYAYAYYAYGADAEAHGDAEAALSSYETAASDDDESPLLWTRIGALRCRLSRPDAEDAFAEAEAIDVTFAPLWRERARCALARERLPEALRFVLLAVEHDPASVPATLLKADILERLGRVDDAWVELVALTVWEPTLKEAWRARHALASRRGDEEQRLAAARRLVALGARDFEPAEPELTPRGEMDAALLRGDLAAARRASKRGRVLASTLALRASALGAGALAHAQAALVLGADPSNVDARIAMAVAADLEGDLRALRDAMAHLPSEPTQPPSELGELLLAELLARRVGAEAGRAVLGSSGVASAAHTDDPVLLAVRERVAALLGGPPVPTTDAVAPESVVAR